MYYKTADLTEIKQDLIESKAYDLEYSFYRIKDLDSDTVCYLTTEYDLGVDTQAVSIIGGDIEQLALCRVTEDWLSLEDCEYNFSTQY
jgi:hypothetical protein